MSVDGWRFRAWAGPAYLLVSVTAAPGCTEQLTDVATIPDGSYSSTELLAPDAMVPAALVDRFSADAPQQALCGDPLLAPEFALDDSGLRTLYVDAAAVAAPPDGSRSAPFRTLGEALLPRSDGALVTALALAPIHRVLVASGYYDEDVAVPPGTLLFGGYDPQGWGPGAGESVISGSVYLGTATAPAGIVSSNGVLTVDITATAPPEVASRLTALTRFSVGGGVAVVAGARALLRDNVIVPVFFAATDIGPDARRALAVWVDRATVRADHNRLVLPADDPLSIISLGFFTWSSCAWITENEITDYRSPIFFYKGPGVAATFNVIRRGHNGVGTSGNQALIAANFIHTHQPSPGCVYAVTMDEDAHPVIRDNTIYLTHAGNRGILEEDRASRPTALLGNRFYSPQRSADLYIHHRGAVDADIVTQVDTLNGLPEIADIGGNTFTLVAAMP
jgi:hypothetical protein